MTNPFLDSLLPQDPNKKREDNFLDSLYVGGPSQRPIFDPNPIEEPGLFEWGKNVIVNTGKLLWNGPSEYPFGPKFDQALNKSFEDFKNWFSNTDFTLADAGNLVKEVAITPFSPSRWGQIFRGIAQGPVDILEASSGMNLGGSDYSPLTPDQRSEKIKSAIGAGIGLAAGYGIAKGLGSIEAGLVGKPSASASVGELMATKAPIGPLARGFIKGSVEASVAGTAYTLVARAGEEDLATSVIMNGILFAPVGGMAGLVSRYKGMKSGNVPVPEQNIQLARDLAYAKGVKFTSDQSFVNVVNNVESLATSDNLAKAFIEGKLKTDPTKAYIFEGITDLDGVWSVISRYNQRRAKTRKVTPNIAIHKREDKTFDILFGGKHDISKTKKLFEQTGQAEGRVVSFQGIDYKVDKVITEVEKGKKNFKLKISPLFPERSPYSDYDLPYTETVSVNEVRYKPNEIFQVEALTPEKYVDQVFSRWASEVVKLSSNKASGIADAHFSDPVSFRGVLAKITREMGFDLTDFPVLARKVEHKLGEFLEKQMPPEDREWLGKARGNLTKYQEHYRENLRKGLENRGEYLNEVAWNNGMYIDTENAGVIALRSSDDGRLLTKTNTLEEAFDFIQKSGQTETFSFGDDLKALPTNIAAPLGLPRYQEGWYPTKKNKFMGDIANQFRARASYLFTAGDNIKAIDNMVGTKLYEKVFYKTQEAITRHYAQISKKEKLLGPLDKALSKLSPERRRLLTQLRETDSPENWAINGVVKGRPLSPEVMKEAQWFVDNPDVDFGKLYEFRRMRENVLKNGGNPEDVRILLDQLGPLEQEGVARFDLIAGNDPTEISLYEVVRYSQAKRTGELSKGDFIKRYGITKEELSIDRQIESILEMFRKEEGLPDDRTLNNYFAHYRTFVKNPSSQTFYDMVRGTSGRSTENFLSELTRTGEIDQYIDNPIDMLRLRIKAHSKATILNPALNEAKAALQAELEPLIKTGVNVKAPFDRINAYLDALVSRPDQASQFTQATIELGNKVWGLEKESIDKLVKYAVSTVELATQGMRPGQGIRDINSAWLNYHVRFGTKRAKDWFKYFLDGELSKKLLDDGHIIGLNINEFVSAGDSFKEGVKGQGAKAFEKSLRVGFKGSLQQPVHVRAQAAAFMETFKKAEKVLLELSRNKITKKKAYDDLLLGDAYDPSVAQAFDSKVSAGKFYEAARLLAQETARETIGQYGAAYHPYKWNTTTGRLMGQFGQWAAMELGYFMRLASTGSLKYRYGAMARWAANQGAIFAVEKTFGLNLTSWYMSPASTMYQGSPIYQMIGTGLSATSASDYERKQGTQSLNRLLPLDQERIAQLYIPFSYATRDLVRATDLMARDFYFQSPLQAVGIQANPNERGLIDEWMGNYPQLSR